ncbi:MAG: CRTAC1 family protein [Devosia sp.]|nr:CRTAC1 family protein [Devosia sp.]
MKSLLSVALTALIGLGSAAPGWAADAAGLPAASPDRAAALAKLTVPSFTEEAQAAGIKQVYAGGFEFFVGGGGAALDCNGDDLPDVVLAGGTNPAALYVNHSAVGGTLKFVQSVGADLGLPAKDLLDATGAYALDIDGDGIKDIVLLRNAGNRVLKGLGDCKFKRLDQEWHIDPGHAWTTAFAATWEAGNKFPTLAFGNYVDRTAPGTPWGTCSDNVLMRPKAGSDTPDYSDATPLTPGYCALSMLFTDWNHSGEAALRIANDRQYYRGGEEQMWKVSPGQTPRLYTRSDGWAHLSIWGMGIAQADLNNNGLPVYAVSSMGDTKLQALENPSDPSSPQYYDVAFERGATAQMPYIDGPKLPSTGWHVEFADFNNDCTQDLFISKGNVEAMADFAKFDPNDLLLQTPDGKFVESGDAAGMALNRIGRGAIIDDFNRDGMLDILVINRKTNVSLFRNLGTATPWGHRTMGNWVEIEVVDPTTGNRDAVGARLLVKAGTHAETQIISVGGGHASGHTGPVHFGLGMIDRGIVRIQWPDGSWSPDYRFNANQHIVITRGDTLATYRALDGDG